MTTHKTKKAELKKQGSYISNELTEYERGSNLNRLRHTLQGGELALLPQQKEKIIAECKERVLLLFSLWDQLDSAYRLMPVPHHKAVAKFDTVQSLHGGMGILNPNTGWMNYFIRSMNIRNIHHHQPEWGAMPNPAGLDVTLLVYAYLRGRRYNAALPEHGGHFRHLGSVPLLNGKHEVKHGAPPLMLPHLPPSTKVQRCYGDEYEAYPVAVTSALTGDTFMLFCDMSSPDNTLQTVAFT
jgi:hypothetical protein